MAEVVVEDGHGGCLTFLEVDGFRFPNFGEEIVRGVQHLSLRPDDVLVCAYPKSGTHWVWEIIRQLLALKETEEGKYELGYVPLKEKDEGFLEMTSSEDLNSQPSPRVLNTHLYFHQLPQQVMTSGCRIVTLVRDPRDVAVSYYHHHSKLSDLYHYEGEWKHYLPLFLQGKLDYGCWFDYHRSWHRGLLQHPHLPVMSLSYERLKQDCVAAIQQLAQFLGVGHSESVISQIVKTCSFDAMRRSKGPLETDSTGQPIMYRTGKTGSWKSVFTVAQAEQFASVYRDKMADFATEGSSCDKTSSLLSLIAEYDPDMK